VAKGLATMAYARTQRPEGNHGTPPPHNNFLWLMPYALAALAIAGLTLPASRTSPSLIPRTPPVASSGTEVLPLGGLGSPRYNRPPVDPVLEFEILLVGEDPFSSARNPLSSATDLSGEGQNSNTTAGPTIATAHS